MLYVLHVRAVCCAPRRTGEEEAVRAYIAKNGVFKHLDNQVARLAVKLPTPTRKMRVSMCMAVHVRDSMRGRAR